MPLNTNISGQTKNSKDKEAKCLTENQDRHIYKKVERGKVVNIDTIKQEIDQDVDKLDDTSGEINPYHECIVNKAERENTILSQMEQWSVLCNVINYIQYDRHARNVYELYIKTINQKGHRKIYNKEEERQVLELDFSNMPEKLKG